MYEFLENIDINITKINCGKIIFYMENVKTTISQAEK